MVLVFYVSGHGFGHATRDIAIVNQIRRQAPDCRVRMRTAVPRWFLEQSLEGPAGIEHVDADTGVVQIDSLALDAKATARETGAFYRDFPARVDAEARYLEQAGASIVVGDVPPLAFAAAARAGVPSVAVANFTWDWIYEAYPDFDLAAPGTLDIIRGAYATATLALRLPFHGGFAPMRDVTRDVPLVARRSRKGREAAREALGLESGRPVVLASFGGHGARLPLEEIARRGGMTLLLTDHEAAGASRPAADGMRCLDGPELVSLGLRYEDLVAAADVVVSKPGYGIVSECIANGAALLYTSRGHFAEHDVLVAGMRPVLRCRYIAPEDLRDGRWREAVDALIEQPLPERRMDADGAAVVAAAILDVEGWRGVQAQVSVAL